MWHLNHILRFLVLQAWVKYGIHIPSKLAGGDDPVGLRNHCVRNRPIQSLWGRACKNKQTNKNINRSFRDIKSIGHKISIQHSLMNEGQLLPPGPTGWGDRHSRSNSRGSPNCQGCPLGRSCPGHDGGRNQKVFEERWEISWMLHVEPYFLPPSGRPQPCPLPPAWQWTEITHDRVRNDSELKLHMTLSLHSFLEFTSSHSQQPWGSSCDKWTHWWQKGLQPVKDPITIKYFKHLL